MPLIEWEKLTDEQREKVKIMYADLSTVSQYRYNFDDDGSYHGRQYYHPGTMKAESTVPEKSEPQPEPQEIDATDAAVKLAEEHGIDLADVEGTGAGGRILLSDVREYLEKE